MYPFPEPLVAWTSIHLDSRYLLAQCFYFLFSLSNLLPSQITNLFIDTPSLSSPPPLYPLVIAPTPNGFNNSARGWNSFGIQANPLTSPNFVFNQEHVIAQCDVLSTTLAGMGFTYCSLDSGWSEWDRGDEHGRIMADKRVFDIPKLADHLHARGLQLGLYVVPGGFHRDMNKTIYGTNIHIGDVCSGDSGLLRCNWHYGQKGVQEWHDSVVAKFAEWGVDFIKLDFVTPGSPMLLPKNSSGTVIAYHEAISKSKSLRPMRLDISWKLARDPVHYSIWSSNADSFRTDQDINNAGEDSGTFTRWEVVQRAIDNYRQYVVMHTGQGRGEGETLKIYPDMDNLYVGNGEEIDGVEDRMRWTIMNHWIGAGSNLMIGNDLENLDALGKHILTHPSLLSLATFTARYPMRPRNPGTGLGEAKQLQAWIAGPDEHGKTLVLLVNYGPDRGQAGFGNRGVGVVDVSPSYDGSGYSGNGYYQPRARGGGGMGSVLMANLDEGESVLLELQPLREWK
ncbi:glycoside hydrolase [Dendrothele bispora CBS 962.96]|uniref:alpha-galactosidase n=1 Tax=Dendrothele bispora (strain CBS 962.96) TaxID=1314807 RepID=A0A4V4HDJ6_DENBC|nr:glycoside hydrolase [Dendrothele bispora CBS 962.96]